MKIVFIGCVESSAAALSVLLSLKEVEVAGVVTLKESAFNADFADLMPLARAKNIPVVFDESDPAKTASFLKSHAPDYIFCIGWSRLLPQDILSIPKHGVVGYHPTLLPLNRGRHPIIWALIHGLKETGSSFFLMGEGADSGPILSQEKVAIAENETATTLYKKLIGVMQQQLKTFVPLMAAGKLVPKPQDHTKATYWEKRSKKDGIIDWNKSASEIDRLIRALAPPYPGAIFMHKDREVTAREAQIVPCDIACKPGTILEQNRHFLLVKCGTDAIKIALTGEEKAYG